MENQIRRAPVSINASKIEESLNEMGAKGYSLIDIQPFNRMRNAGTYRSEIDPDQVFLSFGRCKNRYHYLAYSCKVNEAGEEEMNATINRMAEQGYDLFKMLLLQTIAVRRDPGIIRSRFRCFIMILYKEVF